MKYLWKLNYRNTESLLPPIDILFIIDKSGRYAVRRMDNVTLDQYNDTITKIIKYLKGVKRI